MGYISSGHGERENRIGNKRTVKTILFSARANSLYVNLNPVSKFLIFIILSIAVVRTLTEKFPDPLLSSLILITDVIFLVESGTIKYFYKSYLALLLVVLFVLFIWWVVFNQVGSNVIFSANIFSYTFNLTTQSVYIGVSKVLGYGAMAFLTLLTLMTTRDYDVVEGMTKAHLPFKVVMFFSLMFRSLNIMTEDLDSIRQAQFARGGKRGKFNILKRGKDFISLSIPVTASMISRSVSVGAALEARGFEKAKNISDPLNVRRMRFYDYISIALAVIILVVSYTFNLTNLYLLHP